MPSDHVIDTRLNYLLADWAEAQGLEIQSVDEALYTSTLTEYQRGWLQAFKDVLSVARP